MCMTIGVWRLNGISKRRWFSYIMKKRKKKKTQEKYRAVMYCRVGTAEQLSPDDRKKEPLIVQKNKKALIS